MSKSVAVFRPVITTDEILGTLEALSCIPKSNMPSGARSLMSKLQTQAFKIDAGIAKPAYIQSGNRAVAITNLTVDDLGGNNNRNDKDTLSTNVATCLFNPANNSGNAIGMPAELTNDMEAQLLAMEAAMLAEVAGNGAGSENVISERRKIPRTSDTLGSSTLGSSITTDDITTDDL